MSTLSSAELVSFDVWMTLIHNNPNSKPAQAAMVSEAFGIDDPDFISIMRQEDKGADDLTDRTGIQYGPVERLERIARRVGVAISQTGLVDLAQRAQDLAADYLPLPMEDRLLESLDKIRGAGLKTALISNTGFLNGERMRANLRAIGIMDRMDYGLFSNEEGVAKPDVRIFRKLAEVSGVAPERIVHIGDNRKADVDGALNAGFQAVHLAKESDHGLRVATIEELADLISGAA